MSFYHRLGIEFELHAHGTGPEHYASLTSGYVFEIYPVTAGDNNSVKVRLGFLVSEVDALVASIREIPVSIVSEPRDSEWGRRAVLHDFDGNTVELLDFANRDKHEIQTVWVFNGSNANFPSGVFTSRESAETWIATKGLAGILTEYPLDVPVYDYAIAMNWFTPKREDQKLSQFIQRFTSASQNHYHYEDGKTNSDSANSK